MSRCRWGASSLTCALLLARSLASAQPAAPPPVPPAPARPAQPAAAPPPAGGPAAASAIELRDAPATEDTLATALATRPGGLTSDQAAQKALGASPALVGRTAEIDAAAAQVDEAMAAFLPRLTLRAAYTRLSPVDISLGGGALVGVLTPGPLTVGPCPGGGTAQCLLDASGQPAGATPFSIETPLDNYAITASLTVPVSDYVLRLRSARTAAKSTESAAFLARDGEKLTVEAQARTAFYNWARALGQVAVAEKSLERAKARRSDVATAFALGTATKADELRLEALVAGSEALVAQAVALRELSAQQLRMLLNHTGPLALGENVLEPEAALPVSDSLEPLVAEAMSRRLELKSMSARLTALGATASATRAGMLPRLEAFADVTYANPNQRSFGAGAEWQGSWSAGAALTWSVNDLLSVSATATGIDANARALAANQTAIKNGIRMEVIAAFLDRQKAQTNLAAASRNAVASQEAYRVAVDLYRVGRATTTEVIDVEAELVAAQLQLLNARIDQRLSRMMLAYAVGREEGPTSSAGGKTRDARAAGDR